MYETLIVISSDTVGPLLDVISLSIIYGGVGVLYQLYQLMRQLGERDNAFLVSTQSHGKVRQKECVRNPSRPDPDRTRRVGRTGFRYLCY